MFDCDLGCGGGDGDCGDAREANEVEKRRKEVVAIVGVVSTIGSLPLPEIDTNGDMFSQEMCRDYKLARVRSAANGHVSFAVWDPGFFLAGSGLKRTVPFICVVNLAR